MNVFRFIVAVFIYNSASPCFAQNNFSNSQNNSSVLCAASISNSSTTNVACFGENTGAIDITVQLDTTGCSSNTVVLNEIMHRPLNGNGSNPNAGEFIELLAPPNTNIGCYVLTDGDWTITLPPNTIVPADGIFSIGNNIVYGAGTFNLDAENCNCFTEGGGGGGLLILTDGGEYVGLFNNNGVFVQGLLYGSPTSANSPPNGNAVVAGSINTIGLAGCPAQINIPLPTSFNTVPPLANNGDSYQRTPDGSGAWTLPNGNTLNQCNAPNNAIYSVVWSNGISTEDISNLSAGFYTVTVTDGNGCVDSQSFTVTQPSQISISTASLNNANCGLSNGSLQIAVSGGNNASYSAIWSNGNTNLSINNLSAGQYSVTITDANNCQNRYTQTITNPSAPTLSLTSTNVDCNSNSTGTASVITTGGTAPFSFIWSNSETVAIISGLAANNYSITVTDNLGCVSSGTITISEPAQLNTPDIQTTDVLCFGQNNGTITITVQDGTMPYSYLWSNNITTQNLNNLSADSYIVTVTDANNCQLIRFIDVLQPDSLIFNTAQLVDTVSCTNLTDGQLNPTLIGGIVPYLYLWTNTAQTTSNINNLAAGNYDLTVTDANGCTATQRYQVFNRITISVNAIIDSFNSTAALLNNNQNISFSVQNPVANQPYNWAISPSTGLNLINNNTANVSATAANTGSYTLTVSAITTDGCVDTANLFVEVVNPFLGMPSAFTPNGDGNNDLYRPISLVPQYIKEFIIYNRWGQQVYNSSTLENGGWNGEVANQPQSKDVYIYTISYQLPTQNKATSLRGEFTLLR